MNVETKTVAHGDEVDCEECGAELIWGEKYVDIKDEGYTTCYCPGCAKSELESGLRDSNEAISETREELNELLEEAKGIREALYSL